MSTVPVADLGLIKNEDNFFDIDLTSDIDASDELWFTAKYRKSDTDAEAALLLTRGAGISDVDPNTGKAQVRVTAAQASLLVGRGLIYDVKVKKADTGQVTTVTAGTIRLVDSTNTTAS